MWMMNQFPHDLLYNDMNIRAEVNLTFKFENKTFYAILRHVITVDSWK
jgi:hypothetical protein